MRSVLALGLGVMLAGAGMAWAEESAGAPAEATATPVAATLAPASTEETPAPAPEKDAPAVALLRRVEANNAETKTLHARFSQEREDAYFGDTVLAEGEFWYSAPDRFRSTYRSEHPSDIWMMDGKLINYVPSNRQVDIVHLAQGEGAPINQLLLGFGAKVERIQEVFEVSMAAEPRAGMVGIDFASRDLARSMDYGSITIYFAEDSLEPRIIIARDPANVITVELKRVRVNTRIDEKVFETKWPDRTVVIEHGG